MLFRDLLEHIAYFHCCYCVACFEISPLHCHRPEIPTTSLRATSCTFLLSSFAVSIADYAVVFCCRFTAPITSNALFMLFFLLLFSFMPCCCVPLLVLLRCLLRFFSTFHSLLSTCFSVLSAPYPTNMSLYSVSLAIAPFALQDVPFLVLRALLKASPPATCCSLRALLLRVALFVLFCFCFLRF